MDVLKVAYDITIFLQSPKLTLSDLYGRWLRMTKIDLKRHIDAGGLKSKFAKILFDALESRKPVINDGDQHTSGPRNGLSRSTIQK